MQQKPLGLLTAILAGTTLAGALCHAEPIETTYPRFDLDLGLTVPGKIIQMVEPGTVVKKGDVLIELEDNLGLAAIERLTLLANNEVSIEAAKAALDLANVQLEQIQKMFAAAAAGPNELQQALVTVVIRKLELKSAKLEQEVTGKQLNEANVAHQRFTLKAPVDGIVERVRIDEQVRGREVAAGEIVQGGEVVMRLVSLDQLRIDAPIHLTKALQLKVGDKAWVRSSLPGHDRYVQGRIVYISRVAMTATQDLLVRIEAPNEDGYLGAGWRVSVKLDEPDSMASAEPTKE